MHPRHLVIAAAMVATTSLASEVKAGGGSTPSWGRVIGFYMPLSGRELNGVDLNGSALDGRVVTKVSLNDVELAGGTLPLVWLTKTRFHGIDEDGHSVKRRKFVGATFQATLDDDTTLPLYVNAIERHPDHANRDVLGYELWYPTASSWEPLCGLNDDGQAMYAIPLNGRWSYEEGTPDGGSWFDDPDAVTFACEGYVLAKCVTAGYKPWTRLRTCSQGQGCEWADLADHHQACTRALRGDYLGDGTSRTRDGVAINLYDGLGLRIDGDDWTIEAEWDADGAVCINQVRLPEYQSALAPLLYAADCGDTSFFDDGTLLMTETDVGL